MRQVLEKKEIYTQSFFFKIRMLNTPVFEKLSIAQCESKSTKARVEASPKIMSPYTKPGILNWKVIGSRREPQAQGSSPC